MTQAKTIQLILSITALTLIIIHIIFPKITIDTITVCLITLAIVPWLSSIIKSVEVPGLGKLEFHVQTLENKVTAIEGIAQSAIRKSDFATADVSNTTSQPLQSAPTESELITLANEYNSIRKRLNSGNERTKAMVAIFRQMTELVARISGYDVESALMNTKDGGIRLTAYAYLFTKPDFFQLSNLAICLTAIEQTPFGQYWAIQALGKVIATRLGRTVDTIDSDTIIKLNDFQTTLQSGTDRHYELGKILGDLNSRAKS